MQKDVSFPKTFPVDGYRINMVKLQWFIQDILRVFIKLVDKDKLGYLHFKLIGD